MKAGQWRLNGESIIVDWDHNIADGQHRLGAIVKTGVTADFVVVRGINPDCFPTIDRGKPRSNGNVFAMHGVANFNTVASAVTGVLNYRRALSITVKKEGGGIAFGSLNSYIRPSTTDLLAEYDSHSEKYEHAVKLSLMCRDKIAPSSSATVAALALIDGKMGHEWVDDFWMAFKSGANLSEKSPILKLKERMEKNNKSDAKISQHQITMLCVKAWNLYAGEKECGVLRVDSDGATPIA